jgi:cytidine deaminase
MFVRIEQGPFIEMIKSVPIFELTSTIALRSCCNIKVGAVLYDKYGIFAWGWNHSGHNGMGQCAERHAISRANPSRLPRSSISIVAIRRGKYICSIPCVTCFNALIRRSIRAFSCFDQDKIWRTYQM